MGYTGPKVTGKHFLEQMEVMRAIGITPMIDVYLDNTGTLVVRNCDLMVIKVKDVLTDLVSVNKNIQPAFRLSYICDGDGASGCVKKIDETMSDLGLKYKIFTVDRDVIEYINEFFEVEVGLILEGLVDEMRNPLWDLKDRGYSHVAVEYCHPLHERILDLANNARELSDGKVRTWGFTTAEMVDSCKPLIAKEMGVITPIPNKVCECLNLS